MAPLSNMPEKGASEVPDHNCATLGDAVNGALRALEVSDPRLQGLFRYVDFAEERRFSDKALYRMLMPVEPASQSNADAFEPMLDDLIEGHASAHDEVTGYLCPSAVVRLMADLLDFEAGRTVYDPACGSGEMLIEAALRLGDPGPEASPRQFVGAERNLLVWARTKMSLRLHGIGGIAIDPHDPLTGPARLASDRRDGPATRLQFDYVLGNPPFSYSDWDVDVWAAHHPSETARYGRPPRARADFAFVLHMLASLKPKGAMAVILPYGALFRGAEAKIRHAMVREDLLDAVVRLGPNLFHKTSIPVALLLFQHVRSSERRGKVLMVDCEAERALSPKKNELSDVLVRHIIDAVRGFHDEPGFSRVMTRDQLERNSHNFSLSIPLQSVPPTSKTRSRKGLPQMAQPNREAVPSNANAAIRTAAAALEEARETKRQRIFTLLSRGLRGASYDEPEFGEFPQGWSTTTIHELGGEDLLRNGVSIAKDRIGRGALYLGQEAVTDDGAVDFNSNKRVALTPNELFIHELRRGDLLLIRVHGSAHRCGRVALVHDIPEPAVSQSSMMRVRAPPARIAPLLLMHWLNHPPVRARMGLPASKSSQASINQQTIGALPCPLVAPAEQQKLVAEMRRLDEAVEAATRRLELLMVANRII